MATLSETKTRLSSITSTQKVVKAMELVASSKIKKSREKAKNVEFFFQSALESMVYLQSYDLKNLFFCEKAKDKTLILAISSDMGLCGAYNANINKQMLKEYEEENNNAQIIAVGKKAVEKLGYEKIPAIATFADYATYDEYELALKITEEITKQINNLEINNLKIVYTQFINPLSQEVAVIDFAQINEEIRNMSYTQKALTEIEPDIETVFQKFQESYIIGIVYSALLQSFASEHAHRRNSMENANNNSLELIDKLNIEINRIRQANITQEITEIISGSESLNEE